MGFPRSPHFTSKTKDILEVTKLLYTSENKIVILAQRDERG